MPEASGVGNNAVKEYVDDKTKLEVMKEMMLQIVYPVGSIYMSTANVSPAVFLGGTWSPLDQGRVLIGAGSAYPAGEEGGEEEHVLSVDEMPAHAHTENSAGSHSHSGSAQIEGLHSHSLSLCTVTEKTYLNYMYPYDYNSYPVFALNYISSGTREWVNNPSKVLTESSAGSHSHTLSINSGGSHQHTINNTGGDGAHNNMQPYLSVYMWKRTA